MTEQYSNCDNSHIKNAIGVYFKSSFLNQHNGQ